MVKDITNYVSECDNCQKAKNKKIQMKPLLQSISIPKGSMKQVGIDLTQLPEVNRYKHLIVLIDYFSKWVGSVPLFDKTEKSVALYLYKYNATDFSVLSKRAVLKCRLTNKAVTL